MRSVLLVSAVLAVAAVLASACGDDPPQDRAAESVASQTDAVDTPADAAAAAEVATTAESAAPSEVSADVPGLELIDVATGDGVQLRSLLPADTPVLFWFWAPH